MNVFVALNRKLVAISLIALSGLGILVQTSTRPAVGAAGRVPTGDAFYVPPHPLKNAKPGTIIRSTPIAARRPGRAAWKILYLSRAVDGHDIAVSGVVVAPTGPAPHGGRPVVTWAHGGGGLADSCAPSKQPDIASGRVRRSHRLSARAHSDAADVPRCGLCRRGHRLRGPRHSRLAPVTRGRERGTRRARRGPRRTTA